MPRSHWIETTVPTPRGEVLLPVRVRAEAKGQRVRVRAYRRAGTGWTPLQTFPWVDVGFDPTPEALDELAAGGADAVIDWIEQNAPAVWATVLARGGIVPVEPPQPTT